MKITVGDKVRILKYEKPNTGHVLEIKGWLFKKYLCTYPSMSSNPYYPVYKAWFSKPEIVLLNEEDE